MYEAEQFRVGGGFRPLPCPRNERVFVCACVCSYFRVRSFARHFVRFGAIRYFRRGFSFAVFAGLFRNIMANYRPFVIFVFVCCFRLFSIVFFVVFGDNFDRCCGVVPLL